MPRALYATNVYHYDHVILAMANALGDVGLVRRFELTSEQLEKFNRLLPSSLLKLMARRVREPARTRHKAYSLGPGQLLLPSLTRLGLATKPWHIRAVTAEYARRTAKAAKDYDYFHFSEGLGHKALQSHDFDFSICERRNFHHAVYEDRVEPFGAFPVNARPDPIGDVLDFEYAHSDCILVYSEAAKASFIERGFRENKVRVSPIGIGPQLPRLQLKREPHQLLYVGRGDVYKGLDLAVEVSQLLGSPFRLLVAGAMPPEVVKWMRSKDGVEYLGVLNREELRSVYSSSTMMVLPSTESFGLAAAEAVYHGLPLLCSTRTGIAEYLPPSTKSVVAGRVPEVWASAAKELMDRQRWQNKQETERDLALAFKNLSWQSSAARLELLYSELLTGR